MVITLGDELLRKGLLVAELRTKHTQNLGADQFCFLPNTGTLRLKCHYFRDRPKDNFEIG